MTGARWIKVDATIVECFRAWGEPWRAAHPRFEIVADIKTATGSIERVSSQQRLNTFTHHWRHRILGTSCPQSGIPRVARCAWSSAGMCGTTRR
jgi:hypothetical protein